MTGNSRPILSRIRLATAGRNATNRWTGVFGRRRRMVAVVAVGVVSLAATGCPGNDAGGGSGPGDTSAGTTDAPTTTTLPPNRPPVIAVDSFVWAVGERLDARLSVGDPDGTVTRIVWHRPPPGFGHPGGADTSFSWTPPVAGTWRGEVTATDDGGATATAEVAFVSRHPRRQYTLVALGDSVAAGFGLDLTDALLGDPCWRAPRAAYPSLVMDRLVEAGKVPAGEAQVVLAACSGSSTVDVWEPPTWLPPGAPRDLDGTALEPTGLGRAGQSGLRHAHRRCQRRGCRGPVDRPRR